jgi:hypothetical protein
MKTVKIAVVTAAALLLAAAPALAQADAVQTESGNVFKSVLRVVIGWVFPACAAYCFLYGIIGKGVKRGEWDMAAICTLAAIALALFPKLLQSLFNFTLS